jgi:hypothetical protein
MIAAMSRALRGTAVAGTGVDLQTGAVLLVGWAVALVATLT